MPSSTDTFGAATRALTIFSLAATLLSTPLSEARAERGLGIAEAAGVMGPRPADRSAAPASRPDSASFSSEFAPRIGPLAERNAENWGELVGWSKNLQETNELDEQFAKYRVAIPELDAMEKKFDEFERAMR